MTNNSNKRLWNAYLDYTALLHTKVNPISGHSGNKIIRALYVLNIEPEYVRLDVDNDLLIKLGEDRYIEVSFEGTLAYCNGGNEVYPETVEKLIEILNDSSN